MPFDPCGMVCDLVRTCYDRECRFWTDSNQTATIRWYRAPAGAKVFPEPQRFNSLFWYSRPWEAEGVGEVYDAKATYFGGDTPPGVTGQSYFGPLEYFKHGAPFDPGHVTLRTPAGPADACVGCERPAIADETGTCSFVLTEDGGFIWLE